MTDDDRELPPGAPTVEFMKAFLATFDQPRDGDGFVHR